MNSLYVCAEVYPLLKTGGLADVVLPASAWPEKTGTASNTEPVLSLRFEGETETDALEYRDLFLNVLNTFSQVEKINLS